MRLTQFTRSETSNSVAAQSTPVATAMPAGTTAPAATTPMGGATMAPSAVTMATASGTLTAKPFNNDVDVLNYALTLEHLEATFYRQGLAKFATSAFTALGFQASVRDYVTRIGSDEDAHVTLLTKVVTQLGGTPVKEATYNFPYTDLASFLKLGMAIENLGVAAYTGAAQYLIDSNQLLTAALTIHAVEGRHAAYLNLLNTTSPFPDALNPADTKEQVLKVAGPFIVGS